MNTPLHIVILAAGEGKRMNSRHPKVLAPIGGQAMLAHLLDTAAALNPETVHVVIGAGAEQVRAEFVDFGGTWIEQKERLGTGHALAQALPHIPSGARVLVLPGDMPLIQPVTLERLLACGEQLAVLSFIAGDPTGYGRILRAKERRVTGIREERDASDAEKRIAEVNSGVMLATSDDFGHWLEKIDRDNAQGEYYLTDCVSLAVTDGAGVEAVVADNPEELLGANDRAQLAELEKAFQTRARARLMTTGATLADPATVMVRGQVTAGRDVVLDTGVILAGTVILGDDVRIGAGCILTDCELAPGTEVQPYCMLEGVRTTGACIIGPFARLRPGTELAAGCKVGNFVEVKNTRMEAGAKASHLTYLGDASVGAEANIGAGTITCNYDGANKHRTEIGRNAFVGSNTSLIAPVRVGEDATIGAGSVIGTDAPKGRLTLSRARQKTVEGWERPKNSVK